MCTTAQWASVQTMSGLRVRGRTDTATREMRPSPTSAMKAASGVLGTCPLKPPTGRNSRPVARTKVLTWAEVSQVSAACVGGLVRAKAAMAGQVATLRCQPVCSAAVAAAGW